MEQIMTSVNLKERTLINCEEKQQQIMRLIILKMAASWLEKQDWVTTPYGGQNPVQDLLFQTQLTANRIWEEFFKGKENTQGADELKRQILEIGDLTPEIRHLFDAHLKSKLVNNFVA